MLQFVKLLAAAKKVAPALSTAAVGFGVADAVTDEDLMASAGTAIADAGKWFLAFFGADADPEERKAEIPFESVDDATVFAQWASDPANVQAAQSAGKKLEAYWEALKDSLAVELGELSGKLRSLPREEQMAAILALRDWNGSPELPATVARYMSDRLEAHLRPQAALPILAQARTAYQRAHRAVRNP